MDEKSYENNLIYDISYKTLIGKKQLRIMLGKVKWFFKNDDGIKYLVLLGLGKIWGHFQ